MDFLRFFQAVCLSHVYVSITYSLKHLFCLCCLRLKRSILSHTYAGRVTKLRHQSSGFVIRCRQSCGYSCVFCCGTRDTCKVRKAGNETSYVYGSKRRALRLVFCTRKTADPHFLVVCLGLGGVGIALVVGPLALVGRLLEILPDLALVHFVDEVGLSLCNEDNLLNQASLDLLLDRVDPGKRD